MILGATTSNCLNFLKFSFKFSDTPASVAFDVLSFGNAYSFPGP